jgi:uncharacterized membrane-anchored protein
MIIVRVTHVDDETGIISAERAYTDDCRREWDLDKLFDNIRDTAKATEGYSKRED